MQNKSKHSQAVQLWTSVKQHLDDVEAVFEQHIESYGRIVAQEKIFLQREVGLPLVLQLPRTNCT